MKISKELRAIAEQQHPELNVGIKKNKYGVSKASERTSNGKVYDSKAEMKYAQKLERLKSAIDIKERVISFEEQVPFLIEINGVKICKYMLDFLVVYHDRVEHIDVKGVATPLFRLKKKLVEAMYPIKIIEIKK